MTKVNPIPPGFHSVTPHVVVRDAAGAIEFYKKAFGAEELFRMPGPDGKSVLHAELTIGDSRIMLGQEDMNMPGPRSPQTLNGTTFNVHLYVADADAAFKRAVGAGAVPAMPPADMFWGDRYGVVVDPYGHNWSIATHVKDLTPDQMAKAMQEAFAKGGCGG